MSNTTLTPHISCRNGNEAVAFYQRAFGAVVEMSFNMPDGRLMHSQLNIDGASIFVMDEFPERGGLGPQSLGGTPVMLALRVNDCDAAFQRAIDAGCEVLMPLEDMFWGDRWGLLADPYGHKWTVCTAIRQVSTEEIEAAMATAAH
jgi:PhnB protein